MRLKIKKYLIPHKDNGHIPHILRLRAAFSLAAIASLLLGWAFFQPVFLQKTDFIATIAGRVLVDLANKSRVKESLNTLRVSPLLEEAARRKAEDMVQKGYFSHVSPAGVTPWQWLTEVGYRYAYAGENLAVDFADSDTVNNAWLNSPSHRANILNTRFTEIGIAAVQGEYQGRKTIFVVQIFGTPRKTPILEQRKESKEVAGMVKAQNKEPEIIYHDETFIAVRDHGSPESQAHEVKNFLKISTAQAVANSSMFEKILLGPKRVLMGLYSAIGILVLFSLMLTLLLPLREKTAKHFLHVLYGVALFIFILTTFYMSISFLSGFQII